MDNKNLEKNKQKNKGGFTLIETIVAIFILVLAVTGPMSAAQNSLKSSFLARDQVVAFYLAQDAIEYLKNYKDQNIVSNSQNLINSNILNQCSVANKPCEINTLIGGSGNNFATRCNSGTCEPLCFDASDKKYKPTLNGSCPDGSDLSKFTREVYLEKIVDEKEYSVTVVIKWKPNFFTPREIVVQENLYNWLPQ